MKTRIVDLEELARELKKNPNLKGRPTHFEKLQNSWYMGVHILSNLPAHFLNEFEIQVEPEVIEFWTYLTGESLTIPLTTDSINRFEVNKPVKVRVEILDE